MQLTDKILLKLDFNSSLLLRIWPLNYVQIYQPRTTRP